MVQVYNSDGRREPFLKTLACLSLFVSKSISLSPCQFLHLVWFGQEQRGIKAAENIISLPSISDVGEIKCLHETQGILKDKTTTLTTVCSGCSCLTKVTEVSAAIPLENSSLLCCVKVLHLAQRTELLTQYLYST